MPALRKDDHAIGTSVVAFLVAGVLFTASVVAVLVTTRTGTDSETLQDAPASATYTVQAAGLADILLSSPGYAGGATFGHAGANADGSMAAADQIDRLGLLDPQSSQGLLDFVKLQNLNRAELFANGTDGWVNYEEARESLGLEEAGLDFHIRAYPALPSLAEMNTTQQRDRNIRVTYIGDIDVSQQPPDVAAVPPTQGLYWGCIGADTPETPPTAATCGSPRTSCEKTPTDGSSFPAGYPPIPEASYRIGTWVYNGGVEPTQFSGTFQFDHVGAAHGTQDPADQNANTWMVPAGEWVFLYVDVPATDNFGGCDDNSVVTVNVRDLGTASLTSATDPDTLPPVQAEEAQRDMWLDTWQPYFKNPDNRSNVPPATDSTCPEPVKLWYSGSHPGGGGNGANSDDLDGNGQPFHSDWLYFQIEDQDGDVVLTKSYQHTWKGGGIIPDSISGMPKICLPIGGYTATLVYCGDGDGACTAATADTMRVTERILVHDSTILPYSPVPPGPTTSYNSTTASLVEVEYLSLLADNFCPYVYSTDDVAAMDDAQTWDSRCSPYPQPGGRNLAATSPTQYGDVFPDSTQALNEDLPKRLSYDPSRCGTDQTVPRFDLTNILIVGSNVNQNAMTSPAAKACVADWIAAGGTLVVLGSGEQNASWLNEVIEAAIQSSSGAISTPDASHPILHTPQELSYPSYDNRDRVWEFVGATAANADTMFSHIIMQGASPITTVSNPGSLTEGDLVLTTWTPYDLFDGAGDAQTTYDQGLMLMHNLLMQSYRELYIDYGPEVPQGTNAVPAIRYVQVQHPGFVDPVQLKLNIFVFPQVHRAG